MNFKINIIIFFLSLGCILCVGADMPQNTALRSLQEIVDKAEDNAVILLRPGVYYGPVVIRKPITIEGNGAVTIDGRGRGTVITVKADKVKLQNLRIINTGNRHDLIDAAIKIENASGCEIVGNKIEKSLFGINLQNAHHNIIKDNEISSLPYELGLRGDGIWAWWSDYNTFTGNKIVNARDFVVYYSMGNVIENNIGINCRYSLHFMFSDINYVRNNYYENNSVGIYNMYSNGIIIEGNTVIRSLGATGMGIGLKEASDTVIKNNIVRYCSRGIGIDQSPFEPDTSNYIIGNELTFNNEAVSFVTDSTRINNIFKGNIFRWNIQDVMLTGSRGKAKGLWENNFWDLYEGFDRNKDGIGDTPHRYFIYADKLWVNNPALQFFRGSVVMTFLDFLQRLAPFSDPELALIDEKPLMRPVAYIWKDEKPVMQKLQTRIAGSKLLELRRGRQGKIILPSSDCAKDSAKCAK